MRLTSKFALLYMVCVAAPLAGFSWLAFDSSRDVIGDVMHAATSSAASDGMAQFTHLLADAGDDVDGWALLQQMQGVRSGDASGELRRELERLLSSRPLFRALVVLDADGRRVAAAGRADARRWRDSDAYRVARGGRHYNSSVFDDGDGRPVLAISAPLRVEAGSAAVAGVLIGVLDWSAVQRELASLSLLGHAQDAEHRFVLVSRDDGRVLYDTLGTSPPGLPQTPGYRMLTVDGRNYFVATADASLAAGAASGGSERAPWTLHTLLSSELAYARVEQLSDRFMIIGWVMLAFATIAMFMALHALLRPLLALARASDRLAVNDFESPLPVPGNDEIGGLTRSFARMRDAVAAHNATLEAEVRERRDAEQRALRAQQETLDASRAKSRFLAAMSHEIRTPINGVLGMTDLLLKCDLNTRQRRFAENIERSGEVLLGVVNDILDLSRIEAGRLQLDDSPFDLRAVLEDIIDMLAESANRKGIELGCVIPADLPTAVSGDALRLRQVLTNLLGNAVKFTEQGEVALRVECLSHDGERAQMRFEVRDTGIGIEQQALTRIFDAFSQADDSTTRRFGGTGLGLSICRHLVDLMGGRIGVESRPGEGSMFWFTTALKLAEPTASSGEAAASLTGLRVLVVDDNATNREILSHQLTDLGAEHATAASGDEALHALLRAHRRGDPFDVAVIDQQMPGMDGIELARAVRTATPLADLPLVVLSSIDGDGDSDEEWRRIGIESHLTKPIRHAELHRCLSAACRLRADDAAPLPRHAAAARRILEGRRALLAEDHPVNREVEVAMLELLGCEVRVAADGVLALEALEHERFDVVLMDCDMPVMDGFEATRALREREQATAAPRAIVIALTANSLEGDRERCLQAGMDDYISKPVVTDTLRETLLRWLPPALTTSAAIDNDLPALDVRVIDGIRATSGEQAAPLLRELAQRYASNFERDVQALRAALETHDVRAARQLATRLKSSSSTLGAYALAARCQVIESAVAVDAFTLEGAVIEGLCREFKRVQQALDEECRRVA